MRRSSPLPRRIILPRGTVNVRRPLTGRRVATLIGIFAVAVAVALLEEHIANLPRAVDGDALTIGEDHFVLYGIDAPEVGQPCLSGGDCGAKAKSYLGSLIDSHTVECQRRGEEDTNGRIPAQCTADGVDLGRAMVRSGNAMADRGAATLYAKDEPGAFDFERPSQWREEQPEQPERRHNRRS